MSRRSRKLARKHRFHGLGSLGMTPMTKTIAGLGIIAALAGGVYWFIRTRKPAGSP